MNTINPPVVMSTPVEMPTTAESMTPKMVLIKLNPMAASKVFLNDKFSLNAESPGRTSNATTNMVPMTLLREQWWLPPANRNLPKAVW